MEYGIRLIVASKDTNIEICRKYIFPNETVRDQSHVDLLRILGTKDPHLHIIKFSRDEEAD